MKKKDIIKSTRNIKKSTLAIDVAPAAIPPKQKIAATMAITKNISVQRNIVCLLINLHVEKFVP